MSPADIAAEHNRGRVPHQAAIDWFARQGVTALGGLATKMWTGAFDFVLIDDVVFLDGGAFEFARHTDKAEPEPACTILARDMCGDAYDVVAWAANANRIARWLGRASLLGEDELYAPRLLDGLPVHAGPLEWLQARRRGVVILNKLRAAPLLRDAGPLLVPSAEHGRVLHKMLQTPPPRILVPTQQQVAA